MKQASHPAVWKSRFVDNQGNDETTFGNKSISGLLRSSKPDHHKKTPKANNGFGT